jgi:Rrf2 family transcriptional regulator, iron-sulfur cluster assembly transcription factor
MIFSTRSSYGLRAMIYLAKKEKFSPVSLTEISQAEKISLKYLERLFSNLKKANLIRALRGATGGYVLAKKAKQINIYDIIKALEGKMKPFHCMGNNEKIYCHKGCNCEVTYVLSRVERAINSTLSRIKLSQLL